MTQAHGATWGREPAGSGAVPTVSPVTFVADGLDVTESASAPEGFAFFLISGDYVLINLTPVLGVYYDTGGNAQAIDPATTHRLFAVNVGGDTQLY